MRQKSDTHHQFYRMRSICSLWCTVGLEMATYCVKWACSNYSGISFNKDENGKSSFFVSSNG